MGSHGVVSWSLLAMGSSFQLSLLEWSDKPGCGWCLRMMVDEP